MSDAMVERGALERVEPDPEGAQAALDEARRHARSARAIAGSDLNGAYQLAYDAARKAVLVRMRRDGLRVRRGEGAHALTAEYARRELDDPLGRRLDAMRRRRNRSEYGMISFTGDDVEDAISIAETLIEQVS